MNPAAWNVENLAEHLELRPSDVENFLSHFDLISEHANYLDQSGPDQSLTAADDQFSITDDLPKQNYS